MASVRSHVLVASSLLALASCTASSARNVRSGGLAISVGGVATVGAAGVVAAVATEPYLWQSTLLLGSSVLATGLVLLAGGHLAVRAHGPEPVAAAAGPDPATLARRGTAWELTRTAEAAAIAGDCPQVHALARQVAALDADFHAVVFARNAAIARCAE